MYSCYIGSIVPWAGTFAPLDWQFCCGQQISIQQYQALYSIIGMTYGGDGRTYFNLPDLQGKFPMNQGTGPGLPPIDIGDTGGVNSGQLTNVPYHNHAFPGSVTTSFAVSATGGTLSGPAPANAAGMLQRKIGPTSYASVAMYTPPATTTSDIGQLTITPPTVPAVSGTTGSTTPSAFATVPPFVTVNYIICMYGDYYPVRP